MFSEFELEIDDTESCDLSRATSTQKSGLKIQKIVEIQSTKYQALWFRLLPKGAHSCLNNAGSRHHILFAVRIKEVIAALGAKSNWFCVDLSPNLVYFWLFFHVYKILILANFNHMGEI